MSICNAHFAPKNGELDRLATWYNYNGSVKKQIDYFLITDKNKIGSQE